ncbi:MAG TPA: C13 family peptidase [Burkholderiales bacterium]|nr:C13 family peptidase [Burkholderiales bacterium]
MLWDDLGRNLIAGTRLALFLPVRALDFRISIGQYVALVFASLAFWLAGGMLRAGFPGTVDFGALTAALAEIPLLLGTCLLAARVFREAQLAVAFAVLLVATDPVFEVVGVAVEAAARLGVFEPDADAVYWAFIAWGFAVLPRTLYVLTGWRGRSSVVAFGLFAGLLAVLVAVFPRTEIWIAARDDRAEAARPRLTQEEVFHRQGFLLDEQLAALSPERPGIVDLYFVGVAGDSQQDTFYSELVSVKELLEERFDAAGRSIALINNTATLKNYPIATASNLRATLAHLGNVINTEEDIVLLHIATHGGNDYRLALDLPPLELAQLTPSSLARMLADSGIKWKVIVISACFSGGFIEPLKDDNTLIITAADAFHSSFGCDYESDYTWFSQALYDEALRDTFSFVEAFEAAREAVGDREREEGYPPSNPQMFAGAAMLKKLAALEKRLAARATDPPQRSRASSVRASESTIVLANGR